MGHPAGWATLSCKFLIINKLTGWATRHNVLTIYRHPPGMGQVSPKEGRTWGTRLALLGSGLAALAGVRRKFLG